MVVVGEGDGEIAICSEGFVDSEVVSELKGGGDKKDADANKHGEPATEMVCNDLTNGFLSDDAEFCAQRQVGHHKGHRHKNYPSHAIALAGTNL